MRQKVGMGQMFCPGSEVLLLLARLFWKCKMELLHNIWEFWHIPIPYHRLITSFTFGKKHTKEHTTLTTKSEQKQDVVKKHLAKILQKFPKLTIAPAWKKSGSIWKLTKSVRQKNKGQNCFNNNKNQSHQNQATDDGLWNLRACHANDLSFLPRY